MKTLVGTQTVVSRDGSTIAYDKVGQGPAVTLVAGVFSYRTYPAVVQLADLLAQHFTVFNYDRGDSGDTAPHAVEREIEDPQALVEAAGGSASTSWRCKSRHCSLMRRIGNRRRTLLNTSPP